MCSADIFLGVLAILFPPLPVWVKCGICSADSLINILLCMLGFVPGLLHSWYIIAKFPEPSYEYESLPQDREGGRVTYVFVHGNDGNRERQHVQAQQPKPNAAPNAKPAPGPSPNYGTNNAGQSSSSPAQGNGEGSSEGAPPPTYAEVVGDNKVQTSN